MTLIGPLEKTVIDKAIQFSAVQTPGFSPPAPAPSRKLRLREKNSGSGRKFQASVNL